MADSIVTAEQIAEQEALNDKFIAQLPSWRQIQRKNEETCGDYIIENFWPEIVANLKLRPNHDDFIHCQVSCSAEKGKRITWALQKITDVDKINNSSLKESGLVYYRNGVLGFKKLADEYDKMLIVIRWLFDEDYIKYELGGVNEDNPSILFQPCQYQSLVPRPYIPPSVQTKNKPAKKKMVQEKDLEQDLLSWMHSMGVDAENQISTIKHRMDLWIPGKCFLELKRGKVSGDDVCQAIDYCAEYQLPVVLVGNHIGTMASRGIEAFNKAVDSEMIAFVQWSAIKTYIKGLLLLNSAN